MQVNDRVIVLKTVRFGESDLVVQVLSPQEGVMSLMAKGAMRSRKRFGGGVLEPSHYIQVQYRRRGDSEKMPILQEAQLLEGFEALRVHYERLETALYFLGLVSRVGQVGDQDSKGLFDLLGNGLRALLRRDDFSLLRTHFETKLLFQQGVLPPNLPGLEKLNVSIGQGSLKDFSKRDHFAIKSQVHHLLQQYMSS